MDVALQMLDLLARRYAFAEVAALVADGVCTGRRTDDQIAVIEQLCAFGDRLIALDAEDFGNPDAAAGANTDHAMADRVTGDAVPAALVARALKCRMPQSASEPDRGALGSLRPAFRLLLEVITVRWTRRETSALVAALHIASEYLPMLAWEPALGHAGDPARMAASVGGKHSLWGQMENRDCPHTRPEKSAADRALRVANEPQPGWRAYLDRQHSAVSSALRVCAADCRTRCSVITRYDASTQERLKHACALADEFTSSQLIQLRHSAPVGHGFGVPSLAQVTAAWDHTRELIANKEPRVRVDDGYPLPGLPSLVSALAGVDITPDTLVADTVAALRAALR